MAITTSQLAVTSSWQQVSESDCTLQSNVYGTKYHVAVGTETPTDAALFLNLDEPTTFSYKEPVWVRLSAKGPSGMQRVLNIIK